MKVCLNCGNLHNGSDSVCEQCKPILEKRLEDLGKNEPQVKLSILDYIMNIIAIIMALVGM